MKALPPRERPRERLSRYGTEVLSAIELLAILLGSGTPDRTVLQLAAGLLETFGSLQALASASLSELQQVKGIGQAKAIQIQAAFALSRRIEETAHESLVDEPEKVYQLIQPQLTRSEVELLVVVLRDVQRKCLHQEVIGKGTLTELLIHPREIFHTAIRHRAHSVIIAHNHPSGKPHPSAKDLEMTRLLAQAGAVVGIELSDHLIIGKEGYVSFYKAGLLRKGATHY